MSFLHPALALAAAASIALPIVIHFLFRRRRVPIDWAAMEILREAVRRTNRRLRMEQWLVLLLRCAALLAIGLAVAVPYFGQSDASRESLRDWIVVLDDGATSGLRVGASSEFERVRADAQAAIAARRPGERVGVVRASVPPRVELAPTADAASIDGALARIEPSESPSDLRGAIELARALGLDSADSAAERRAQVLVVASAFREGSLPTQAVLGAAGDEGSGDEGSGETPRVEAENPAENRTTVIATAPAQELENDVRIGRVDARVTPAGNVVAVRVELTREGGSLGRQETRVRAMGDGLARTDARTVLWEPGQSEASIEYQLVMQSPPSDASRAQEASSEATAATGRRRAIEVRIDDDALSVGNSASVVVDVRPELEVAVVGRRGSFDGSDIESIPASLWIARALSPAVGSGMRVRELDPASVDARALLGFDAVFVARPDLLSPASCDALGALVSRGGLVVVSPAGETLAQAWGSTLFPRLGVPLRAPAEATVEASALRMLEEQPTSTLLSALSPEMSALVAPIEVRRVLRYEGATKDSVVLALADGSPLVVAMSPGSAAGSVQKTNEDARDGSSGVETLTPTPEGAGLVVALATAPEIAWSNLPVKPLMVPLMQEIVRAGVMQAAGRSDAFVGERVRAPAGSVLRAADGASVRIGDDGSALEPVRRVGVLRGDDGTVVAVNVRGESIALAVRGEEDVRAALAPIGAVRIASKSEAALSEQARGAGSGASTWPLWLLVAGLAVLLVEGFLSRLFSHASIARAGRGDGGIATVGRVRGKRAASAANSSSNSSSSSSSSSSSAESFAGGAA